MFGTRAFMLLPVSSKIVRIDLVNNFFQTVRYCSTGRFYTKKHEWVMIKNEIGTVGISDYAQESLGDIVYVELPEVGGQVEKGDSVGTIESVKAASDVYTPVSGKIHEINETTTDEPNIINKSPYEKGWLFKIILSNPDELKGLMNEEAYQKFKQEEGDH
ncbi:Glycine cleavage system H protein, mitochondrial [Strongyloides ratti]|uniref:Glycine cleavage system H protein n=1 Tax=Strongyloides ratti TaxID=34506 RepID=A0A090LDK5_STRRB|nr:Glycine cleavage system H protein, mitochondrial [Strongyloides ratti]CEF67886.1 Glycine cleavage system H protein, mitochondrial [Strongyloides ratti]